MKKRRKRIVDGIVGILLSATVLVVLVWNLFVPDQEISTKESRVLAQRPKLTLNSLVSGEFMEKYETYLADQFAGRDLWRNLKVTLGRLGGVRQENGVVLGDGGQLFETLESPNQDTFAETLSALGSFAEEHSDMDVYMMLVPDAACVLTDKRPYLATFPDQNLMLTQVKRGLPDSITWIDVTEVLNGHAEEKIYYQTDAHWTSLGAYYAFGAAAEQLGIPKDSISEYAAYPVSTSFNGILSSKSGYCLDVQEEIDIYVAKGRDNDVVVNYVDEQRKTTSLYDSSCLEGANQYELFLGGDTSVLDIRTASESGRRLLVVKDSFANCFIPFLAPHFREIVVVDPHYYSGTLQELLGTYRISDVLFLYSGNGFFQDNSLSGVLGNG
ncbi:MAG: hypothetical protein HFH23_17945 [Ruminococcus sp.]|nr:hypothetical protein [Ruminococcus sp.]